MYVTFTINHHSQWELHGPNPGGLAPAILSKIFCAFLNPNREMVYKKPHILFPNIHLLDTEIFCYSVMCRVSEASNIVDVAQFDSSTNRLRYLRV
jgi:hypothetical protein